MQTISKLGLITLSLAIIFFSCKQRESATEESTPKAATKSMSSPSPSSPQNKLPERKFIRTADLKFKVKNVEKATNAIEKATSNVGGFVTQTNLQSTVLEQIATKISQDSLLETTKYSVENNLTIRVPNDKLDTVISVISKQIDFLDFRVIKADDVSIQLLSNQLAQNRSSKKEKRLEKAIDTKGTKLKSIVDAEDKLGDQVEQNDTKKIENLSLEDQVNFSTLTIQIYQRDTFRQELVSNEKNKNAYRPALWIEIKDAFVSGWYLIESILTFIIQLWSIIILLIIGLFFYKKYYKMKSKIE
jgi:hypothetical protein